MAQGAPPDNVIRPSQFSPTGGGSGPEGPTIEVRLSQLETSVVEIRRDVQAIRLDLAELKGRLSNLPTTFQLIFMQAALMLAMFAAAFGLIKIANPH